MKNKEKKEQIKNGLIEVFLELVVYGVAFLIGAVIIGLFGFDIDDSSVDGDLVVLIGLVVPLVVFAALVGTVSFCIKKIKKAIKTKKEPKENTKTEGENV
ncbi:MAG: hypothetical protein IJF33_05295 [Clostridia bacterium]|nr:hypothetical protein [Clostridia bacterium]